MDGIADVSPDLWRQYASAEPGTIGGNYLRTFWQPVAMSSEVESGRTRPIHVMGERHTLYRGETGTPHIVGFRCAHRATQLSTGWVRGDDLQCMYHGWTYDGDGACIYRPGEKQTGRFERADIGGYPAREHLGLIYGYFGEGEPPPFPPFEGYRNVGVIENHVLDFPANWFQTTENHFDEVHIAFVHSFGGSHNDLGRSGFQLPEMKIYETGYGMIRETRVEGGDWRKTLYLLPNIMRILIPTFAELNDAGGWRDTYIIIVPTDDENHRVYFTQNVHIAEDEMDAWREVHDRFNARVRAAPPIAELAHKILAGEAHITDHMDHPHLLLLEDAVTQGGQGQFTDRSRELLGRTDVGIVEMRKVFLREMQAHADGRPLTAWNYRGEEPALGFAPGSG